MKFSVSSYSFQGLVRKGQMSQVDCIEKAKELGFDAIEFSDLCVPEGMALEAYAHLLRERADQAGLPVSNLAVGADLLNQDRDREIQRLRQMVDMAAILGAPTLRHDAAGSAGTYRTFGNALPVLADACREITAYAAEKGVKTMVENHGRFCQDSIRVEQLVSAVDHPNFGLLVDMGNFLCADEAPEIAVGRVAPLAFYVHAKDFHVKPADGPNPGEGFFTSRGGTYLRGAIIGHGSVPVLHCLKALKQAGYDGYVSIEFEGMEDPLQAIPIGLANLKQFLSLLK